MTDNISNKKYLTAFINNSATVREKAGSDITNAAHKAVMCDASGNAVIANKGDKAFGVILSDVRSSDNESDLITKKGTEIDILIKHIGLIEAAAY